jgi:hypothetical protein
MRQFVNLFTRRGLLGANAMYHLSRSYADEAHAHATQDILPDAGWKFVATLPVDVPDSFTPDAAAERLRAAAVLIGDVLGTLNATTTHCDHCGRDRASDPIEAKAHQALTQTREKLLDWADTLYLPRDQRADSPGARRARARRR